MQLFSLFHNSYKKAIFFLLIFCISSTQLFAQTVSNKGKEFWVGYGHHQFMENQDGQNNTQNMVIYLSTEAQAATVKITIDSSGVGALPNTWWSRTYTIPPYTVISTGDATNPATSNTGSAGSSGPMPKKPVPSMGGAGASDPYDCRLWNDPAPAGNGGNGLFRKKAIHIESNVPIVAYAHIYGSVSSGATMLLPVETWGYSYTTINSQQGPNVTAAFNFVYVIAKEDNTKVEITPSANSRVGFQNISSSYVWPANTPFTVNLMKGQIYQYIAEVDGSGTGPQLTGTKIKSISNGLGDCKPIAVFAGSSRTAGEYSVCGSSGRDNDFQQCFPEHTWGKRYLTTPFSIASSSNLNAAGAMTSVYKVAVKDPTTIVKRNGVQLSGLINNKYYQFSSNTADYIECDKPVMVGQFMSNGSSCSGGSGQGDPEMIYLSPMEQAIKQTGCYRNTVEAITANYVSLTVPTNGISSLKIDGVSIATSSLPASGTGNVLYIYNHPNKIGYKVVVRGWSASKAQVIIQCDSAFNAITYGLGGAESYGYSAGAQLNNLNGIPGYHNTPDTSATNSVHPNTFINAPVQIGAYIAYKPTKMVWKISTIGCSIVTPCSDVTINSPTPIDSLIIGSAKYYLYRLPGDYVFSVAGTYYLPIILTSPNSDNGNCNNEETVSIEVIVKPKPTASFTYTQPAGCTMNPVQFNAPATTPEGYPIIKYKWFFTTNPADTSSQQNPSFLFNAALTYPVKLIIITQNGGTDTITNNVIVSVGTGPHASYTTSATTICVGQSITFTPTSSYPGTTGWWWNFGDGTTPVTANTNAAQVHTFNTAGVDTVKHVIIGTGFPCPSDTVKTIITVRAAPVIASTSSDTTTTCGGSDGAIKINGLSATTTYTVYYTSGSTVNTLTLTSNASGVIIIPNLSAGTYTNISVKVGDCISNVIATQGVYEPLNPATPIAGSNSPVCEGGVLNLTSSSATNGVSFSWTGPNGFSSSAQNPQINSVSTSATGTYTVVAKKNNCNSLAATTSVTINANPVIGSTATANPTSCSTTTGSISLNGLLSNTIYVVKYTVGTTNTTVNITSNASGTVVINNLAAGTYSNITVSLNTCESAAVGPFTLTDPNPPATPTAGSNSPICAGNTLSLNANSATAGVSYEWTGPNGFTSNVQNPTISNATTNATGNYGVKVKLAGCTSIETIISVVVNVVPATPSATSNSPICAGTTLNLNANSTTSGVTYNWTGPNGFVSVIQNPSISNATTAATGSYSVTAYLSGCTSSVATTNVTVNAIPNISSATISNTTTCATATGSISLNGLIAGETYTIIYYKGATPTTLSLTANAAGVVVIPNLNAGTYSNITATLYNCVSNVVGPFTIVDPTPPATPTIISNNSPVCSGSAIVLTANSAETNPTFSWTTPGGSTLTGSTITISNATSSDAGSYTVNVTVNSCTSANATPVTVVVKPTPNISGSSSTNPTACATATGSIILNGFTAGTTYTINYKKNSVAQTPLSLTADASGNITIPNLTSGVYNNITATLNGCTSAEVGAFTLSDPNPPATPTITANPALTVCSGTNVTLTANSTTSGVVYNWTGPNSFAASNTNAINLNNINSTHAGTYTVTATLASCTSLAGTATVVVNTTPVITSSSFTNPTNCNTNTGTITLNGLQASTSFKVIYTKNGGTPDTVIMSSTAGGVIVIPNLGAGIYSNVSVLLGTCPSNIVGSFTLTDPAAPAKPTFISNSPICADATLNVSTNSITSGVTYNWTGPNGFTFSGSTPPAFTNAQPNLSGYYIVTVTKNSCTSVDSILLTVNYNPVVDFDMSPFVCMPNGTVTFTNNSTITSGTNTYTWDFGDASAFVTTNNATHIYSAISTYQITLTATSNTGCIKAKTKPFNAFYDKPLAGFTVTPDTLCQGTTNTFIDTSSAPNSTITTRMWNFADVNTWITTNSLTQTKLYANPGDYEVKLVVKNLQGCISDTAKKIVKVYLQPVVDAGPSFLIPAGTVIKFNPSVNDTTLKFRWLPITGLSNADSLRPTLTATKNQTYWLTATGLGNCSAKDSLTVTVLQTLRIPNAFSPNGDGINDTWVIANMTEYIFATVEVFDRNGHLVYYSNGYKQPWDGTYNGKKVPIGIYYYIIDFKGKFGFPKQSGSVTLLR